MFKIPFANLSIITKWFDDAGFDIIQYQAEDMSNDLSPQIIHQVLCQKEEKVHYLEGHEISSVSEVRVTGIEDFKELPLQECSFVSDQIKEQEFESWVANETKDSTEIVLPIGSKLPYY